MTAAKGRAIAARPLLLLSFTVLFVIAVVPAAQALPTPVLTATNPASPHASLTPRINGTAEEGETKVVTFGVGASSFGPITRDVEPDDTVRIYTLPDCTGTVAGEGTVATLKGEGIPVAAVDPDTVTVFYATVTNGIETSACSSGLPYRQVTTSPGAPAFSSVNPPSPANDNNPRLLGSADPEATVSIYATPDCGGSAVASGSGALFGSSGIQVAVADNSETTFSAKATIAGFGSTCSPAPIAYAEVTPPPVPPPDPGDGGSPGVTPSAPVKPPPPPRLRTVPGGFANENVPRVTGTAPGAGTVNVYATAGCDGAVVARGSAAELAAGLPVRVMDNTVVVFSAVAVTGAAASKCSDPVLYIEDSLTPRTRITMAPAGKTAKRRAIIRFTDTTGSAPGTVFLCKVNRKKWRQCSSPLRLKKLKPRRYRVRVKAADPAGNVEIKGAKRSFRVIRR